MSPPRSVRPSKPASAEPPWFQVGDDRVRLLRDGRQAFPAMLDAIESARREVLLEMYWVGPDVVGTRFRDALTRAAARGVVVRVIYDSLGSLDISLEWWARAVNAGAEVIEFHPVSPMRREFRMKLLETRDHRKMLVVDGEHGFVGGINLSLPWQPEDDGGGGWRDDQIQVIGPAAEELRTLFYRTRRRFVRAVPADLAPVLRIHPRPVWALASRALPRRLLHREYAQRIQRAQRTIDIANPYFVPNLRLRRAIARAVARGVRVRVMVPEHGDVAIVQLAVEALFDALLRHGVEIYLLPPPMLHAKTAVIDDAFTTVGSYNLDERSWRKNLEVNLAVLDPSFAWHVRGWFENDLVRAKRVDLATWRQRSWGRMAGEVLARTFGKLW